MTMNNKKDKIKKLTEEQYNNYLMSLKESKPTMVLDDDGNLTPQD